MKTLICFSALLIFLFYSCKKENNTTNSIQSSNSNILKTIVSHYGPGYYSFDSLNNGLLGRPDYDSLLLYLTNAKLDSALLLEGSGHNDSITIQYHIKIHYSADSMIIEDNNISPFYCKVTGLSKGKFQGQQVAASYGSTNMLSYDNLSLLDSITLVGKSGNNSLFIQTWENLNVSNIIENAELSDVNGMGTMQTKCTSTVEYFQTINQTNLIQFYPSFYDFGLWYKYPTPIPIEFMQYLFGAPNKNLISKINRNYSMGTCRWHRAATATAEILNFNYSFDNFNRPIKIRILDEKGILVREDDINYYP